MDQKRTNEDQMIEWMAAGSSFGLSSPLEPMIEIRRHERGANDTYEIPFGLCALGYTAEDKHLKIIRGHPSGNEQMDEVELAIGKIEHACYSEDAAENRIRYLFQDYVKKTGIFRVKINVWKKVFASNGKANIAIIIEDRLEPPHNEQEP